MTRPLNFTSELERRNWMIENADYFTIVRRAKFKNHCVEVPTLAEARALAKGIVKRWPHVRLIIYAIHRTSDTYVETISGTGAQNAS